MKTVLFAFTIMALGSMAPIHAATIVFNQDDLVASVHTRGQYDNAGLSTWNGQPLSPTDRPSFDQNQLSADWRFYRKHDSNPLGNRI